MGRDSAQDPSFELAVAAFVASAFDPLKPSHGLELVAWTRLPYLSSTVSKTHYVIDSAMFVLKRHRP